MRRVLRVLGYGALTTVAAAALVVGTAAANGNRLAPQPHKVVVDEKVQRLASALRQQEQLTAALATAAVHGRLSSRSVLLLVAPGVPRALVQRTTSALDAAGADVAARVDLLPTYLDPMQDPLAGALADQLAHAAKLHLPAGTGAERSDALLAAALVDRGRAAAAAPTVLAAYQQAGLLAVTGADPHPGGLVLALLPATAAPNGLDTLLQAFARTGVALVVAAAHDGAAGVLTQLRADQALAGHVSTLDDLDSPIGPQAAVLALAATLDGHAGAYGTGTGAPVPSG